MTQPAEQPVGAAIDADLLKSWPMPVHDDGDKFARGTTVVIAGSPRTPGAALLAGEAALRMGAGRLEIVTAAEVAVALGVAVPEALVAPLPTDSYGGLLWDGGDERLTTLLEGADAVLIGPGLLGDAVGDVVSGALELITPDAFVVLDARALPTLRRLEAVLVPRGRLLLTPNRQELRNLAQNVNNGGNHDDGADECVLAEAVAQRYGAAITCFGHVTTTDQCWDVGPSTPGLGTSGSGDVLAGLALGAAARCRDATQAACWATFVHAEAGQRLARRAGELSLLARELVHEVPAVLGDLEP